jgi:glycosyltransferase involved in cell wall biosynthesis
MGAGLPVACFATGNNREYLGEGGTYAETVTASALAEAILVLANDLSLCAKKGAINRIRAEDFSWEKSAEKVEGMYQSLLRQSS